MYLTPSFDTPVSGLQSPVSRQLIIMATYELLLAVTSTTSRRVLRHSGIPPSHPLERVAATLYPDVHASSKPLPPLKHTFFAHLCLHSSCVFHWPLFHNSLFSQLQTVATYFQWSPSSSALTKPACSEYMYRVCGCRRRHHHVIQLTGSPAAHQRPVTQLMGRSLCISNQESQYHS